MSPLVYPHSHRIPVPISSHLQPFSSPDPSPNINSSLHINLSWSITLLLQNLSEGGLAITIQPPPSNTGKYHSASYWIDDSLNWPTLTSNLTQYADSVLAQLDQTFSYLLPQLVRNLQDTLDTQNQLFLPGAGTFFFKDPTFNRHGDLLAEVKYDGVQGDREEFLRKREERRAKEVEGPRRPVALEPLRLKLNFKDAPGFRDVPRPEEMVERKNEQSEM